MAAKPVPCGSRDAAAVPAQTPPTHPPMWATPPSGYLQTIQLFALPRAEFSTAALFPRVSHLTCDSELGMHLSFSPVRARQQPSQAGVGTTPLRLPLGSLPAPTCLLAVAKLPPRIAG